MKPSLHISITVKTAEQTAVEHGFAEEQTQLLEEMLKPEYRNLFQSLIGSGPGLTLSDQEIQEILSDLPGTQVGIVCGFDSGGNVQIIHRASGFNNAVVTGKIGFKTMAKILLIVMQPRRRLSLGLLHVFMHFFLYCGYLQILFGGTICHSIWMISMMEMKQSRSVFTASPRPSSTKNSPWRP